MTTQPLKAARVALLCNLLGTILLALSFQATSSDFRLVTANGYDMTTKTPNSDVTTYAICVNNYVLAATDSRNDVMIGAKQCPNWEAARPAAVVVIEFPILLWLGLILSAAGFLIQFLMTFRIGHWQS